MSTTDSTYPYPDWIREVALLLGRSGAPPHLAGFALALLDLTELDHGPVPRVRWDGQLALEWTAGDRWLKLEFCDVGPGCYWNRQGGGACDLSRPLQRDHAAGLRDLLGWLLTGEPVRFHTKSPAGRKPWWMT